MHPTMLNEEIIFFVEALDSIVNDIKILENDYIYMNRKNEFIHKKELNNNKTDQLIRNWFSL